MYGLSLLLFVYYKKKNLLTIPLYGSEGGELVVFFVKFSHDYCNITCKSGTAYRAVVGLPCSVPWFTLRRGKRGEWARAQETGSTR